MSIKGAIKRIEAVLARNNTNPPMTFVIPYNKDFCQSEQIKTQLIHSHKLNKNEFLLVFIIDFSTDSRLCQKISGFGKL